MSTSQFRASARRMASWATALLLLAGVLAPRVALALDPVGVAGVTKLSKEQLARMKKLSSQANDPYAAYDLAPYSQWPLSKMRVLEAWELARGDAPYGYSTEVAKGWDDGSPRTRSLPVPERVTVAIVDAGFDISHEDLAKNVVAPYDVATRSSVVRDDGLRHGTFVAGVCGAVTNNGKGIAGVSYNARIMPISCPSIGAGAYDNDVHLGVRHVLDVADQYNVRVLNISLGSAGSSADSIGQSLMREARLRGIVPVASAGNEGSTSSVYPCDYDEVVGVMNVDSSDKLWQGFSGLSAKLIGDGGPSNYNAPGSRAKDMCAPGVSIISCIPMGEPSNLLSDYFGSSHYDIGYGTSYAAPAVSGVLALMFSANPYLTSDRAVEILHDTAEDLGPTGFDERFGYGRVDAYEAVKVAKSLRDSPSYEVVLDDAGGSNGSGSAVHLYARYGDAFYDDMTSFRYLNHRMGGDFGSYVCVPQRAGYTFLGYYGSYFDCEQGTFVTDGMAIDANGVFKSGLTSRSFQSDAVLKARWIDNKMRQDPEGLITDESLTKGTIHSILLDPDAGGVRWPSYYGTEVNRVYEVYGKCVYYERKYSADEGMGDGDSSGGKSSSVTAIRTGKFYLDEHIVPTRTGYRFNGYWGVNRRDGTEIQMIKPDGSRDASNFKTTTFNAPVILYARWIPKRYSLTVDPAGGTLDVGSGFAVAAGSYREEKKLLSRTASSASKRIEMDSREHKSLNVSLQPPAEKSVGYEFTGLWDAPGEEGGVRAYEPAEDGKLICSFSPGFEYWAYGARWYHDGDVMLWARWVPKEYELAIDPNGGTMTISKDGLYACGSGSFDGRQSLALPGDGNVSLRWGDANWDVLTGITFTRPGYRFEGLWDARTGDARQVYQADFDQAWSKADADYWDGEGRWHHDGDVTLYARWTVGDAARADLSTIGSVRSFAFTGSEQSFVAPVAGTYLLEAWGAQGGSPAGGGEGGTGGYAATSVSLEAGQLVSVVVGGAGSELAGGYNARLDADDRNAGIGGVTHFATAPGTFLDLDEADVLLVAGGGGGGGTSMVNVGNFQRLVRGVRTGDGYARITPEDKDGASASTFTYINSGQSFVVPSAGTYRLEAWGAQGGQTEAGGGAGGYAAASVELTKGQVIYMVVGGSGGDRAGGYNGGSSGNGGGGGATHFASAPGTLAELDPDDVFLLAGGGGGGGSDRPGNGRARVTLTALQ